jgi:hypothetical protein
MCTKWSNMTALGVNIDDRAFWSLLLAALPHSWDSIVATLYMSQSSHDAINQLMAHWARVSQDRVINMSTSALQMSANNHTWDRQCNSYVMLTPAWS